MTRSRRGVRIFLLAAAGLLVVLIAGGVSMSQWRRRTPPPAALPPASVEPAPPESEAGALSPDPLRAVPDPADAPAPVNFPEPQELSREEIERRRTAAARIRAVIEEGPRDAPPGEFGGVLADAEPVPIYRDGELLGLELREVAEGGFYTRIGLAEGDLVQAINGVPLDGEDLPSEVLWSLSTANQVEIDVEHADGTPQRFTLTRQAILAELEALVRGR
jgi:hypothetical protein